MTDDPTPSEDLRADLDAAIAAHESPDEPPTPPESREEAADTAPAALPDEGSAEEPSPGVSGASEPADADAGESIPAERLTTAPVGWRGPARETWADLPEAARQEIHRRERDISQGLQESAQARDLHRRLNATLEPYQDLLARNQLDPVQAVQGTMQLFQTMQGGTTQQKADALAALVNRYDVDIRTLDEALTRSIRDSSERQLTPEEKRLNALLEQRLAPVNDFMGQLQSRLQQSEASRQDSAESQVQDFSQQEFFQEVRLDMADLLDLAAQRGRAMDLQEAYDLACRAHPEVSRVLAEREQAAQRQGEAARLEAKRAAAVGSGTVRAPAPSRGPEAHRSNGTPPAPANPSEDMRADILAAISAHSGTGDPY